MVVERQKLFFPWLVSQETKPALEFTLGPEPEKFGVEKLISMSNEEASGFLRRNKKGRLVLSDEGKQLSAQIWNQIQNSTDNDQSIENLTQITGDTLEYIKVSTSPEKKSLVRLLELGTEARIKKEERKKLRKEINEGLSPWHNIKKDLEGLYKDKPAAFVDNYTDQWIIGLKRKVRKNISELAPDVKDQQFLIDFYERDLVDNIKAAIHHTPPEEILTIEDKKLNQLLSFSLSRVDSLSLSQDINKTLPTLLAKYEEHYPDNKSESNESTVIETIPEQSEATFVPYIPPVFRTQSVPDPNLKDRIQMKIDHLRQKVQINKGAALLGFSYFAAQVLSATKSFVNSNEISKWLNNLNKEFSSETASQEEYQPILEEIDFPSSPKDYDQLYKPPLSEAQQVVSGSTLLKETTGSIYENSSPNEIVQSELTYEEMFTEALKRFKGLDFSDKARKISIEVLNKPGEEPLLSLSKYPLALPDDATDDEINTYLSNIEPDGESFGARIDFDGNIQVEIHSGQRMDGLSIKANDAEALRKFIEGKGVSSSLTGKEIEEIQKQLEEKLVGTEVNINQEGSETKVFKIDAVGYIPHEFMDNGDETIDTLREIYPEKDENGNILVDAYGLPISKFDKYTNENNRAIILFTCGRTTDKSKPDWYKWSKYTLILTPVEKEQREEKNLEENAQILEGAINTAYDNGIKHGDELADTLKTLLKIQGIETDEILEKELNDVRNFTQLEGGQDENKNNVLQCGEAVTLLSILSNGKIPRIDGWTIYDPDHTEANPVDGKRRVVSVSEYWLDMKTGKPIDALDEVGTIVNTGGVLRSRADTIEMMEPGDLVVADGHILAVLDKWVDENDTSHLKFFDTNFIPNEPGKARIDEVTDENLKQVVGDGPYLVISNYPSN